MGAEAAILLVLTLMMILIVMEMPIAFAMGISGAVGLIVLRDVDYATNVLGSVPFAQTSTFSLTVIPMFILMGVLVVKGDIARQVFTVASHLFRRFPGGLGVSTVMACASFSAVSGSSVATSATMANLSVGEMRKHGYPASLATGIVASAGTLGVLIPPSIMMIIYALLTGESTGKLLIAGILPGLLTAFAYGTYIFVSATLGRWREGAPVAATPYSPSDQLSPGGRVLSGHDADNVALPWGGLVRIAILFLIVIGGIYSGIFTVTESAAIGALTALVMVLFGKRPDHSPWLAEDMKDALSQSAQTTTTIFAIVIGSGILSAFFVISRAPQMLTMWIGDLDLDPMIVMALLLLLIIPLGMFLESISMMVIVVPLFYPIAQELGFDGIWLGVMMIKMIELGLVTPPIGISCYVVSGTSQVPIEQVFRGVIPFLLVDALVIACLFSFPVIATWLPSTMN